MTAPSRAMPARLTDEWALLILAALLLLGYGAELVSTALVADEAYWGDLRRAELLRETLAGGRWGSALAVAILPTVVEPAVHQGLGLAMMTAALWWVARGRLAIGVAPALVVTAVAITLPWLALNVAFGLNALFLGFGFLAVAAACRLIDGHSWRSLAGAVGCIALAYGCYEPMALAAIAAVGGLVAARRPHRIIRAATSLGAGIALSLVVSRLARAVSGIPENPYVADVAAGLDPDRGVGSVAAALGRTVRKTGLTGAIYGQTVPWLAILAVTGTVFALWWVWRARDRWIGLAALAAVLAVPFLAELVADVPYRSMVYLPWVCLSTAGLALPALRRAWGGRPSPRWLAVGVAALAVASNLTLVSNTLASAQVTAERDRYLALRIDEEWRRITQSVGAPEARPVVTLAGQGWPESSWYPSRELIGLSTYPIAQHFGAASLRGMGVPALTPTKAQVERGTALLQTMPSYPQPGWVSIQEGLLLVRIDSCQAVGSASCLAPVTTRR